MRAVVADGVSELKLTKIFSVSVQDLALVNVAERSCSFQFNEHPVCNTDIFFFRDCTLSPRVLA